MKKVLIIIAAVLMAMTSCSKDQNNILCKESGRFEKPNTQNIETYSVKVEVFEVNSNKPDMWGYSVYVENNNGYVTKSHDFRGIGIEGRSAAVDLASATFTNSQVVTDVVSGEKMYALYYDHNYLYVPFSKINPYEW